MHQNKWTVFCGVLSILLAPILGSYFAQIYLRLLGGMETEKFLLLLDGCITAFQLIGVLAAGYGLRGTIKTEKMG